ncbi:DUF4407 domain-containing protein [Niabella drilacis]|uniref:DUF4407 domain-containing protein n=1 Tax=Niabella drilacis (strain DSM 25811 / CCM 8410 / CCUG 62505 / LMG 26954 / E90) TaxID=1285928 RepID=A0A1G6PKF6_NIADE|nr:DUF4407 domain-containing protein [Niabella drilacis]SDC80064.1 protein of unknown function [Niabella drilacis]
MKVRDYYVTPRSNGVMRFLWKAAGGDRYLLERATYSDQVKYMCLGGIVFATGAMAGLAGGYAFYTIFSPRGSALDDMHSYLITILSIFFGIVWGLIIFNIDRFIVTSTGKGDGTEAITWGEFKGAIPRILMGAIIALTISKPIEIRMFKTEIDAKLYEKQLELQKEYEKRTTANFEERLKIVEDDLGELGKQRQDLIERIKSAEHNMQDNLMGKVEGIPPGNGNLTKAIQSQIDALKDELGRFDQINADKLNEAQNKRKQILAEKEVALSKNVKVANGLDGLLERIKLAHEIAGWVISLFITLLFMAIELTPVFFKLMLIKTPYDYLAENRDELIKAENGIEVRYDYYKDKVGQERHLIINHEADKMVYEKIKLTDIQKELTGYAVEQYKNREKRRIDENLDDYIKSINPDEPGNS